MSLHVYMTNQISPSFTNKLLSFVVLIVSSGRPTYSCNASEWASAEASSSASELCLVIDVSNVHPSVLWILYFSVQDRTTRLENVYCSIWGRIMNNSLCGTQLQNSSSTASQVEDPLYSVIIANIVFNGCLCYTTIMMNIVTIHALRKTSSLSKPLKTLLLSLAVSDLGVGLLGQPLNIAYLAEILRCNFPNSPTPIVSLTHVIWITLYLSSFCGIMALTADRLVAIQRPLRYQDIVTHKRVVIVVITIWLFSALLGLCDVLVPFPWEITFIIFVIIESVSFVASTWSSYKIYLTVRRHNIQIQAQTQKSAQSTFCIYLIFWICYLPNFFISIIGEIFGSENMIIRTLYVFSTTLVLLNSSLNPVIYCWKMRHIRHTILKILRNIFRRYNCAAEDSSRWVNSEKYFRKDLRYFLPYKRTNWKWDRGSRIEKLHLNIAMLDFNSTFAQKKTYML